MAGLVRWELYDAAESVTYQLEVNPNDGGSPQRKKTVQTVSTVAPDGFSLIFEGRDEPRKFTWSGISPSEDFHTTLVSWFTKHHQVQLTDDLGRVFWIYITSYKPKRRRSYNYRWKQEYTIEATELDWS